MMVWVLRLYEYEMKGHLEYCPGLKFRVFWIELETFYGK